MKLAAFRPYLTWLLALLVIADLVYSGFQHFSVSLDGDLSAIVVPAPWYSKVLIDPLGLSALLRHEVYPATNRYAIHATMAAYFRHVPLGLGLVVPPITSVYLACALFKLGVQIGLLYLLTGYASGRWRPRGLRFWGTAALIAPLFQTFGFQGEMGAVMASITYCFFFSWPLLVLLVWLRPFYVAQGVDSRFNPRASTVFALLALVPYLALGAPVVSGVAIVLIPGMWLTWAISQVRQTRGLPSWAARLDAAWDAIPRRAALITGGLMVWVVYSVYIGLFNTENQAVPMPLAERYALTWLALTEIFGSQRGTQMLLGAFAFNAALLGWLAWRTPSAMEPRRLLKILGWVFAFSLIYVVLAPLGGYRHYRPHILRYDLLLPITLALMACYGATTMYLIGTLTRGARAAYLLAAISLAVIYTRVDHDKGPRAFYKCEVAALTILSHATEPVVVLPRDCNVMAWGFTDDPAYSETNVQLLRLWGVAPPVVRLYQQK